MQKKDIVTEIRGFNRFYTNILGLLDHQIIDSGYSLTEARILFEISKTEICTAKKLCSILDIDRSYMSKIINKFEKEQLISRSTSHSDNRNIEIQMTEKGKMVFHSMESNADEQIEHLISDLDAADCEKLINSVRTIKKYFSRATKNIVIRPYREEDISYVIDRQLSLYESERHFTSDVWKNYLMQGVIALVEKFDPKKDCMFILECDHSPAGCVAITHAKDQVAQLRYFFLEPELRGLGVGTDLLHKALDFCREKKYSHVFLWTVSAQETARKLYKKAGFEITETSENENWGIPVLEEKWDLDLLLE